MKLKILERTPPMTKKMSGKKYDCVGIFGSGKCVLSRQETKQLGLNIKSKRIICVNCANEYGECNMELKGELMPTKLERLMFPDDHRGKDRSPMMWNKINELVDAHNKPEEEKKAREVTEEGLEKI